MTSLQLCGYSDTELVETSDELRGNVTLIRRQDIVKTMLLLLCVSVNNCNDYNQQGSANVKQNGAHK